jgi:hypothetical protein
MSKRKRDVVKEVHPDLLDQIERLRNRIDRLQRFLELSGPEVCIEQECRMISYGALHVLTIQDRIESEARGEVPAEAARK